MTPTTADGERPFKTARFYGSLEEVITIEVGEDDNQSRYKVHKNVICSTSHFFEAACKPVWMKSEDKVIKLTEDDPEIIRLLIYWAYHDKICIPYLEASLTDMTLEDARATDWGSFIELYLVAERLQMDRLKNDAIDAMIQRNKFEWLPCSLISYAYEKTLPESRLRQLMLDIVRLETSWENEDLLHLMPRDLLEDLVKASWRRISEADRKHPKNIRPLNVDLCQRYYKHSKEVAICLELKQFERYGSDGR